MSEHRNILQYVGMSAFVVLVLASSLYIEMSFLAAFIWGGVLSITVFPLFAALRQRNVGSALAAAMISVGILALVAVPLTVMVSKAVSELPSLYALVQSASQNGIAVPQSVSSIPKLGPKLAALWQKYLADPQALRQWSGSASHVFAASGARTVTHKILEVAETTAIAILSVYFFLVSSDKIVADIDQVARRFLGGDSDRIGENVVGSIRGTVSGLVLVGLGEGIIIGGGYFLEGTPHPALFTLFNAIISVIPFCGPVILAAGAIATFLSEGTSAAVIVAAIGTVAYFVGDHFVRPKLISGNTKLPFLAVLTAIIGGLHALGLLGLFIGPAIIAVAFSLWRRAAEPPEVPNAPRHLSA